MNAGINVPKNLSDKTNFGDTQNAQNAPKPPKTDSDIQLSKRWLHVARICWIVLAVVAGGFLITSLPAYVDNVNKGLPGHSSGAAPNTSFVFLNIIISIISLASAFLSYALAILLFRRRFENPAVASVSFYLLLYSFVMTGPAEFWSSYWLGSSDFAITLQTILMATPTMALLVLFPNGKMVPNWTRWLLLISIPWSLLAILIPITPTPGSTNITGILIIAIPWIALTVLGVYAQIHRYRRVSTPEERQQTKWILFGFGLWIGYILISSIPYFYLESLPPGSPRPWWEPTSILGWFLSLNIVPVSLAIAITRSRLWNLDIVINRALVYGTLTFATMALYIFVVGALGNLLRVGDSTFLAFLTTGLVALLFQPLRERLQSWVNRLMYGERDDPVAVLTRLGEQIERTGSPEDALSGIVKTIARALKLPYVGIELGQDGDIAAAYGLPRQDTIRLPLIYQSEPTGYLLVAARSPGETFSSSDYRLLENIAHQAGAAAHAAKLTIDLRHSRQKLVTTREEERRRLRRDLHDGLGPNLATLALKLDTIRNLLREKPDQAEHLIDDLKKQTQETIQDIRDLVYELRPPALDELGLTGAIQSFINSRFSHNPQITLFVPKELPPLPAAFEVAIYRITLEALTNIQRHAQAKIAAVKLFTQNKYIILDIKDDGIGLSDGYRNGVGLTSMRERAEELGGTFELATTTGGMHVIARLPLPQE
jgi:signal transduction histidine kinase